MSREMNEIEKLLEMIKEAAALKKELEKDGGKQPDIEKIMNSNCTISYQKVSWNTASLKIEGNSANVFIATKEILSSVIRSAPKLARKDFIDFIRLQLIKLEEEFNEENNN